MQEPSIVMSPPLRAGQQYRVFVEAGTLLQVVHGRVQLQLPPAWLAGTAVPLDEGEAHVIATSGWVEVLALADARWRQCAPVPAASGGAGLLARWRRWFNTATRFTRSAA